MIVTNGQLATTLKNVQRKFLNDFRALDAVQGWRELVTVIPSATETEELSWFGDVPQMADVTNDELELGGASAYDYALTNSVYQTGIKFKREWWEDDKLQHGNVLIQRLAARTQQHRGKRALELFADNGNAFDGTAFFDDSRTQGDSGTIDNNISYNAIATTTLTQGEVAGIVEASFAQMSAFADDKGEVLGMTPDLFVVPRQLYVSFYQGLAAGLSGSGQAAPIPPASPRGVVQVGPYKMMLNYLHDTQTEIYALHTQAEVKPFVMIERQQPTVGGITDTSSDWWLIKRQIPYIAHDRFKFGYGDPRTAIQITVT